jgi:hypothetical protein
MQAAGKKWWRGAMLLTIIVTLLIVVAWLGRPEFKAEQMEYGVTFSAPSAEWVTGDWKEVYGAILHDLGVKRLRLSAYWNVIEPADGKFDFSGLDYQMDRAAEEGAQVVLSIGRKLPRWPECHVPDWAAGWPEEQQQARIIKMLAIVIERYQDHPALRMWQLENEPLLDFGGCPPEDRQFLAEEERLVRALDNKHPILITDSGELNWWLDAAKYGDILGTTMYRTVHSIRTNRPFSYDYIFPAWLYRAKARLVKLAEGKDTIISELQGEPWGSGAYIYMSEQERGESFSLDRFIELKKFAERTQLNEAYWWGVEYWYWEKVKNNNPAYWDFAKTLF